MNSELSKIGYIAFLGTNLYKEYDNWLLALDAANRKEIPVGAFLVSARSHKWFDHKMRCVHESQVPPYMLHLQLVLGL